MRTHLLFFLTACSSTSPAAPDAPPPDGPSAATITIASDTPILLAAFRDGVGAPWQAATMHTATSGDLVVHGPYVVAFVYDDGDATAHQFLVDYVAQTPEDEHTVTIQTKFPDPTGSKVTGTLAEPGSIFFGGDLGLATMANEGFLMTVPPGKHDLWAFSASHAFVQHGLDATHDVDLGALDVDANGTALATVLVTATNKTKPEVLTAREIIESPTTPVALVTRLGVANATKVVPEAMLAPTDRQRLSVFATDGGHVRTQRQPFHAGGGPTAVMLPSLLGGVTWTSPLAIHVNGLVPVASLTLSADAEPVHYSLTATQRFLATTHLTDFAFDTQIPGFQAAWQIDPTKHYFRGIYVDREPTADRSESESYEDELNAPPMAQHAPATFCHASENPRRHSACVMER